MGNIANERFTTGNHVAIFTRGPGVRELLGTAEVGRMADAQSVDMQIATGAQHLYGIGDADPIDIVDGRHSYTVSLQRIRLRTREAVDRINAGSIDIDEIDRYSGERIQTAEECHLASGSLSVPANSLVSEGATFLAMRIK